MDNEKLISKIFFEIQKDPSDYRAYEDGNSVELKRENSRLVVVEIQRKVKIKTSANG